MARSSAPAPSNRGGARGSQDPRSRPGQQGARPKRRVRRRAVLGWMGGIAAGGAVLGTGGFAAAYTLIDVPEPNELADAQFSTVFFSDGTTQLGTFAARNRQDVTIAEVPAVVQHAVLAAEDRSFYENRGVSPSGIGRAVWNNLRGGSQQGGSTITQQYVKNYYLSSERTYTRKLQEFVLALKIDNQESKDQILENYLNTVFFGRRAYGIQAAAQAYFGLDVGQLNASQGALLATLLKAPSSYDPRKSPEAAAAATRRVDYVLDGMVAEGWLSPADRAASGLPETVEPTEDNQWSGPDGYLLQTVREELIKTVGLTEDEIDRGGLTIATTFSRSAQDAAVAAVQDQLPADLPEGFHAALSAIDPATGGVVALYGGPDYLANQFNDATKAVAQPGSTFKPFALVAALEQGISLRTTFNGSSPQEVDGSPFSNFGREQFGRIDLTTATEHSVNTVYAQLNEQVTPAKTRDVAVAAGYPADTPGLEGTQYIANVLGTASPHPIDVTQAYATFAARGTRTQWHTIASVDDAAGTRTYTASPSTAQAFSTDVAADATYALEQVVQSGTGSYARRLGRPAAGKTGTTNENLAAWFAGFVPQLAASVALFQTSADGKTNVSLKLGSREVTGGSYPVRIWTDFMQTVLEGTDEEDFPDPVFGGRARGGSSSGTSTRTSSPSSSQTSSPTDSPTQTATQEPTASPTDSPTQAPTASPTGSPSAEPSTPSAPAATEGGTASPAVTADTGAQTPAAVG